MMLFSGAVGKKKRKKLEKKRERELLDDSFNY